MSWILRCSVASGWNKRSRSSGQNSGKCSATEIWKIYIQMTIFEEKNFLLYIGSFLFVKKLNILAIMCYAIRILSDQHNFSELGQNFLLICILLIQYSRCAFYTLSDPQTL